MSVFRNYEYTPCLLRDVINDPQQNDNFLKKIPRK